MLLNQGVDIEWQHKQNWVRPAGVPEESSLFFLTSMNPWNRIVPEIGHWSLVKGRLVYDLLSVRS